MYNFGKIGVLLWVRSKREGLARKTKAGMSGASILRQATNADGTIRMSEMAKNWEEGTKRGGSVGVAVIYRPCIAIRYPYDERRGGRTGEKQGEA